MLLGQSTKSLALALAFALQNIEVKVLEFDMKKIAYGIQYIDWLIGE